VEGGSGRRTQADLGRAGRRGRSGRIQRRALFEGGLRLGLPRRSFLYGRKPAQRLSLRAARHGRPRRPFPEPLAKGSGLGRRWPTARPTGSLLWVCFTPLSTCGSPTCAVPPPGRQAGILPGGQSGTRDPRRNDEGHAAQMPEQPPGGPVTYRSATSEVPVSSHWGVGGCGRGAGGQRGRRGGSLLPNRDQREPSATASGESGPGARRPNGRGS